MIDGDVSFVTKVDLTLALKGIVVTDDINYTGLGENINNFRGVITVSGPQGTIYNNTDYDNPDITPGTSLVGVIPIPLPLDPQTDYQTVLKGNYTVRYTVRDITIPEDSTAVEVYSYQFDEPDIETTISSGPYSGVLRSNDDTDYGSNITTLTREHRIQYPTQLPVPPADLVSSNAYVEVTPIYTNEWTIIITSEVEYTNPDTLQIKWGDSETFTHCVYAGCIDGMYDAIETMRDGFLNAILTSRVQAEAYERRLVVVNTSWHLLNIAYQDGDVAEADEQAAIIAEQIAYTGSGTCGGPTSTLVVACPAFSGGGTPATYTFENGITEVAGTVKLGGVLTENTTITLASYGHLLTASDSGQTASQQISAAVGVLNKASDGTTEGRVYVEGDKVTIERAHLATPTNTRGYEITSAGLVEKADYRAGYGNRNLVSKEYVDSNAGWGSQAVVSDATLTGTGITGDVLAVAAPFPGFDTLNADYGYTEPTHAFSEITTTPDTIAGYGITDAVEVFLDLDDVPSSYSGEAGKVVSVNGAEDALEFTTGPWVPASGGTFTGQVTFATTNDYSILSKRTNAGGASGVPEAGVNRIAFLDGDDDLQGYVGINAGGDMELRTNVSGQVIKLLNSVEITGDLTVSGAFLTDVINEATPAAGVTVDGVLLKDNGITGDYYQFNTGVTPASEPVGLVWWNDDDYTLNISTGLGPVLRVGQEDYVIVYNGTGSQIDNGSSVYPVGGFQGRPSVDLTNSETFVKISGEVMITTMDIPTSSFGIAVPFGKVRGIDTSMWSMGDTLWVSSATDGALINVKPLFPDYAVQVGVVVVEDAADGEISISVKGEPIDTILNFWNGIFRESFDFLVTESGGTITGSLSPTNGHDDMTMIFSDGLTLLDTSPAATITLTGGTDINPQINYVYIPQSTKVLTLSTSDWPTTEHIKVATIVLRTATATSADGALRNQNWNDHIQSTTSNQGHLSHIGERIRQEPAKWDSGSEGTITIDTVPNPDDVFVSVTSGIIYQMHRQVFPALDTEVSDDIHIVNHNSTPYVTETNLNGQTLDSAGVTLNNTSFSFVVWGVANKTGETSHLMLNLPAGSYSRVVPDDAVEDASNYADYTIPKLFQGCGFLIARFVMTQFNGAWTLYQTIDLRGSLPNTVGGGGGGGSGVSTFSALTDTPSSYTSQALKLPQVNAAETALEYTDSPTVVTLNINDANTQIWEDGSDNLTFKDAITGTATLADMVNIKSVSYTACAHTSTTNITIGTTSDISFLLHYTANRDVGTVEHRSGTIEVQYDPVSGGVTSKNGYLGPKLDFTITADESGGDIRLNIIVGSVNTNSVNFDYKTYSKLAA